MMVIKPEKNVVDTDFEFEYIIVNGTRLDSDEAFESDTDEWYWRFYKENFEDEKGQKLLIVVSTCIGLLLCLLVCCICACGYYCCCKPKVIEDPDTGRRFSRRKSSRGSSLGASMRRSMRLESIVSKSGQSFRLTGSMKKKPESMFGGSPPPAAKIVKLDKNDEEQAVLEDVFAMNKDKNYATAGAG